MTLQAEILALASQRILGIGCADRWLERQLPPGCDYIGLDYPPTGALLYRARPTIFGDASRLPFTDACVDAITIFEVVEHLRYPQEALREIARVLRPEGRLLLTVPFLYPIHDAPYDFQRYTVYGLAREVESAGLRVLRITPGLGSAETSGLIANLALGGMALEAIRRRRWSVAIVPLILAAVPVINMLAWSPGRLMPVRCPRFFVFQ